MPPKKSVRNNGGGTGAAGAAAERAVAKGASTGAVRRAQERFVRSPENVKRLLKAVQEFNALGPLPGQSVQGQCKLVSESLGKEGIPISPPTIVKTTTAEIAAYVERTATSAPSPDSDVDRSLDQIMAQKVEFEQYQDGKTAAAAAKNAQDALCRALADDTRRVATQSLDASRMNADARAPAQARPWTVTPVGQFVGGGQFVSGTVHDTEIDLRKRKLEVQEHLAETERKRVELQAANERKRLEVDLAKLEAEEKERAERQRTNDMLMRLLLERSSA